MSGAFRIRLLATSLLLVGVAFIQTPGFLVADTKFDLVAAPADFLARALHLWDGEGAFGQLQNQAYGYLWPMGPFFLLGSLLDVEGWVVQRLWIALVMVVAMVGAARLARALGVRSDLACLGAGVAFALSPRMLTTLGPISIEAWPSAMAPWVLLPLVIGSATGSPRRAAAWSAAAVAMVGGVNAAATFAVIPLGAIWLLTREAGSRRRSLMLWWPVLTVVATLWWLVPLFVLGAYSPPFLDFIETASVTTFPTTPFDVLRGTSDWVPYISADSRAGADLVSTPFLVLNGGVVLALGLAGLLDRRTPHRGFLVSGVLVGVLMVGAGHVGATAGWFAGDLRTLLDGVLAPVRNVHKFDPVLRLPLVLGLAFLLDRAVSSRAGAGAGAEPSRDRAGRVNQVAVVAMVLLVVAGSVVPAAQGRIPTAGATLGVPDYWTQAADWLDRRSEGGTDLLVPGSAFADYVWGQPQDEPMQWLADSPWAVRNVVPLVPPGNIRMLDEIETAFVQGAGSVGLLALLQRAGVQHLVVRNDLAASDDVPDPVLVHAAIDATPGLAKVAGFGPPVGGEPRLESADGAPLLINGGWQAFYDAVEVYAVPDAPAAVTSAAAPVVAGGPEDLADLVGLGVLGDSPTVLAADVGAARAAGQDEGPLRPLVSGLVLTDGLAERERAFGRLHDAESSVTTPGDRPRTTGPERDYPVGDGSPRWRTTAELEGARSLSASSSTSDAGVVGGSRPGELPYAALDGDVDTEWVSAPFATGQAWWRVDLDDPMDADGTDAVTLRGGPGASEDQVVRLRTAAGASAPVSLGPGEEASVALPGGPTSWLRVEDGAPGAHVLSLGEVTMPGLDVRRRLVLPTLPPQWGTPDQVVLRRLADDRSGCVVVPAGATDDVRCVSGRDRVDEEATAMRRTFSLPGAAAYDTRGRFTPTAGRDLDRLLLSDQPVDISASSVAVPDVRAGALAAIDGDPGTTWLADPDDEDPTLQVSWIGLRKVDRIKVTVDPETGASAPTRVELTGAGGGVRRVDLVDGVARFRTLRTDRVTIRLLADDGATGLDFASRSVPVPPGISELRLGGVEYLPLGLSADRRSYGCGSGPTVLVDGFPVRSAVSAAPAQLADGGVVDGRLCGLGRVRFDAGEHTVDVPSTGTFAIDSLVLSAGPPAYAGTARAAAVRAGAATREVVPAPEERSAGTRLTVLRQNVNPGWLARQAGRPLDPVVVDGWQQGWISSSPGDQAAAVEATFAPDTGYRLGLLGGLLLAAGFLLLLVVVAAFRGRRRRPTDLPALDGRPAPSGAVAGVLAVAVAGLVAGTPGAVVAVATALVVVGLRTGVPGRAARRPGGVAGVLAAAAPAAPFLLAAPVLAAAAVYAVRPWGSVAGWAGQIGGVGYLVVVPLAALLVVGSERVLPRRPRGLRRSRRPGPTWRRRRAGRSTSR